jgi:glycerophosphoryl diester phosphodiesterase
MPQPPLIAAHRGGLFLWPENSATAFRHAARLPIAQAECDVHLTADGTPVLMHDATLERTTDGQGPVAALDAAAFARLRLKGAAGEAPPTLAAYLAILAESQVAPRVEIKCGADHRPYPGAVPATLAALDAAGQRARSWIIAFEGETVAACAAAGGLAGLAWLLEGRTLTALGLTGLVAAAQAMRAQEVGFHVRDIDQDIMAACRAAGLGVSCWGANHDCSISRAMALGVDLLTTDDPPLAIARRAG